MSMDAMSQLGISFTVSKVQNHPPTAYHLSIGMKRKGKSQRSDSLKLVGLGGILCHERQAKTLRYRTIYKKIQ